MKKSILLALLIATLTIPLFSGCAAQDDNISTDTPKTEIAEAPEIQEDTLYSDLPEGDLGEYTFRVLNNQSNFAYTLFAPEELTGDAVDDAIYNRNRKVEEKLNINIIEISETYSNITSFIKKSVNADDDLYDIFFNEAYLVSPLALSNILVEVNDIPNLNLSKPWWDKGSIEAYTVKNHLYFINGELHLMNQESVLPVMFNKDIVQDNGLENIYDLVKSGKWTLDKFNDMMKTVSKDLDGDGIITGYDQLGATTHDGMFTGFFAAQGENIIKKDEEGMPYLVETDSRFYAVYDKLIDIMTNKEIVARQSVTSNITNDDGANSWHNIFISGRSLFYLEYLGSAKKLRAMEQNFGIVPFPKFDETQDYVAYVGSLCAVLAVPITNRDLNRTGIILENICAESYRTVRPAYYDIVLYGKTIRDDESAEMLDLIFDRRSYEIGAIYNFEIVGTVNSNLAKGNPDISSVIEKAREKTQKQIEKNFSEW